MDDYHAALTQYIFQVNKLMEITQAHMVSHAQACEGEGNPAVLQVLQGGK